MRINRFHLAFGSMTLYWFLMSALSVTSGSVTKIAITSFLWISAFTLLLNFYLNLNKARSQFSHTGFLLIISVLVLNATNIARGFLDSSSTINTSFGNPYNALALFAPLACAFATNKTTLSRLTKYLMLLMVTGGVLAIVSFAIFGVGSKRQEISSAWILIYPMVFLIGSIAYVSRMEKYAIILVSILFIAYIGLIIGSRATVLRLGMLYSFKWITMAPRRFITSYLYPFTIFILLVFAYQTITTSVSEDESFFQRSLTYLQDFSDQRLSTTLANKADTRTFLYIEVVDDLIETDSLLFGKGSSGTYFSKYFQQTGDDAETRITVEVGFLAYLLKGGIIAAALNLSLLLYASFLAIYRSNSRYVKWIGFMLATHVLLLFVENLLAFDLYNICIWLFVGVCISRDSLSLTDEEILKSLKRPN